VQWGIPAIGFGGTYSGFGNGSEGPYENNNRVIQINNNLSVIRGKHTFRMGGEMRWDNYFQVRPTSLRAASFCSFRTRRTYPGVSGTGDGFADDLLGQTSQAEAAVSICAGAFPGGELCAVFRRYVEDFVEIHAELGYPV
jgi:hypothetical protein